MKKIHIVVGAFPASLVLLYWLAEKWLKLNPSEYVMWFWGVTMGAFTTTAKEIIELVASSVNSLFAYFNYSVAELLEHAVIGLLITLALYTLSGVSARAWDVSIKSIAVRYVVALFVIFLTFFVTVSGVTYLGLPTMFWSAVLPTVMLLFIVFEWWQSRRPEKPVEGAHA